MFHHADLKGTQLPPKALCLTYDDGPGETAGNRPGPRTSELAHYLAEERISAAFFVIGLHAEASPHSLEALHRCGHTIGNHTYSHPGLVALVEGGGDAVAEVARTDAIIRVFANGKRPFFRAPYGNWRQVDPETNEDRPHSIVADVLNASGQFDNY